MGEEREPGGAGLADEQPSAGQPLKPPRSRLPLDVSRELHNPQRYRPGLRGHQHRLVQCPWSHRASDLLDPRGHTTHMVCDLVGAGQGRWTRGALEPAAAGCRDRLLLRVAAERRNVIPAVIQGFSQAGATAAGITNLSPTGVFDQGLSLANKILNATADLGLLDGFFASLIAGITALVVVIAFAIIAAQLLVVLVESFIVIGAGILFLGFAGSRWTKFFTERYLSYLASVGVKLFVLYLIMGVGMGIASRWLPILERGGFSPIPFFYVMGGSLVFVFLTWHIPSVAGSMMAGAVSLSLSDAVYPAMLGSRAAEAGLVMAGAVGAAAVSGVRWGVDRLRVHT